MAVVERYGTGARPPGALDAIDSVFRCAEIRAINSTIKCGDGDEPGSRYIVGYLQSNGLLETGSLVMWDDTGLTAVALGFKDNPNAFGEFDMSAAGGQAIADILSGPAPDYGINDLDERFWSQANLPRDPGGELTLYLTINAGASIADARIKVVLKFFRQG
jgi:hypothetical protein